MRLAGAPWGRYYVRVEVRSVAHRILGNTGMCAQPVAKASSPPDPGRHPALVPDAVVRWEAHLLDVAFLCDVCIYVYIVIHRAEYRRLYWLG
jgi:hypothetical protein